MFWNKKRKGQIQGVVVAAAAIGLLTVLLITAVFLKFMSDNEKKLSDRVYFGLSSINYFYITEKNINEFAQIVTEITAKELGEQCGGVDCYAWTAGYPAYGDLRDKFEKTLREKITGFPTQIGNGGKISFVPPEISDLQMDESRVKISMEPQQVYAETDGFSVRATSSNNMEIEKQIRYLLLAKIGQKLYGNGTYVRDWGRIYVNSGAFDCDNDGVAEKTVSEKQLTSAGVDGCKAKSIDFDTADDAWSGMGDYCKGKQTTVYEPGENVGRVEGGKLYVQIDNLLEYSLVCGIGGADGLASINDFEGTQTGANSYYGSDDCSEPRKSVSCTKEGAVMYTDWVNIDGKINNVLSELEKTVSSVYTVGLNLDVDASAVYAKSWELNSIRTPENRYSSCEGTASGNAETGSCGYSYDRTTSSGSCTGSCGSQQSSYGYSHIKNNHNYNWNMEQYYQYLYDCSRHGGCTGYSCCPISSACGDSTCTSYQTCYSTYYSTSETWSCKYTGNYKFTISDFMATVKITDTAGDKIVKKGTTDFESLYFVVKFKPGVPYLMGEGAAAPPKPGNGAPHPPATQEACAETAGQACKTSCSGGNIAGVGKCDSGKVCCKPASNTCVSQGGTCDIWTSCPADKPLEVPKSSIADCTESNKKCCKPQQSRIVITGEGKDITI